MLTANGRKVKKCPAQHYFCFNVLPKSGIFFFWIGWIFWDQKNVNLTKPSFLKECVRMRKYGSMYYVATHYKLRWNRFI